MSILSKSIALVGPMGSGKSTIGKLLSNEIKVGFIDSDDSLEQYLDLSIAEIFNKFGEKYFRDAEERLILNLASEKNFVLATGGGSLTSSNVRRVLHEKFFIVYIKADIDTLWSRVKLKSENRPLVSGHNAKMRLQKLLEERSEHYSQAHLIVESKLNDKKSEVVKSILIKLRRLSIIGH